MNILILSGSSPYLNSGIAAYDMYKSLTERGHNVFFLTRYYEKHFDEKMFSIYDKALSSIIKINIKIKNKFLYKIRTDSRYYMHSINYEKNYIKTSKVTSKITSKIDAIIYAFPHRFLTDKNLYELNQYYKCPILVIPADLAQLTGGCHYCNNCSGYTHLCGKCPGLFSTKEDDISRKNMLYKKKYVYKTESVILGNNWQLDFIRRSSLYRNKKSFKLDIVINENTFKPGNKKELRIKNKIPTEIRLIFFGAAYLNDERKGFKYLSKALHEMLIDMTDFEKNKTALLIAGNIDENILGELPLISYQLGALNHDQLADAFRMADVFVSPSVMDAGPMMVVQSMMCGTPVVAFDMGNARDYIIDNVTGLICKSYNSECLKDAMLHIINLKEEEILKINENCRNQALCLSSYDSFSNRIDYIVRELKTY